LSVFHFIYVRKFQGVEEGRGRGGKGREEKFKKDVGKSGGLIFFLVDSRSHGVVHSVSFV